MKCSLQVYACKLANNGQNHVRLSAIFTKQVYIKFAKKLQHKGVKLDEKWLIEKLKVFAANNAV